MRGCGRCGQIRQLTAGGAYAWNGYHFSSVHHKVKTDSQPWNRDGIKQHIITAPGFAGYHQPAAVCFGVLDGVLPLGKGLPELNSLGLAVIIFWNYGYSYTR